MVDPEHWGEGVEEVLLDAVEAEARARGIRTIQSWTLHRPDTQGQRLAPPTGFGSIPADDRQTVFMRENGFTLEQVERNSVFDLRGSVRDRRAEARRRGADRRRGLPARDVDRSDAHRVPRRIRRGARADVHRCPCGRARDRRAALGCRARAASGRTPDGPGSDGVGRVRAACADRHDRGLQRAGDRRARRRDPAVRARSCSRITAATGWARS